MSIGEQADRVPSRWRIMFVLAPIGLVLVAVLAWYIRTANAEMDVAYSLWGDTPAAGEVREAATVLIEAYRNLAELATTAFGAIAFLTAYQQQRGIALSVHAWQLLGAALLFLLTSLGFALLGGELLIRMISNNAVDVSQSGLQVGRYGFYACFLLSVIAVGLFALDLAVTPVQRTHHQGSSECGSTQAKAKEGV